MEKQRGNIAKALLECQRKITSVKPDSRNPHFKNNYASLHAVMEVVRPLLNAQGLVVVHLCGFETNNVPKLPEMSNSIFAHQGHDPLPVLITTLIHAESGESVESRFPLPKDLNPQHLGSAISYGKRYNLAALTGLATFDDDAEEAVNMTSEDVQKAREARQGVQSTVQTTKPPTANSQTPKMTYGRKGYITEKQGKRLWAISKQAGVSEVGLRTYLKKTYNIEHSQDIKWQDYEAICKAVESGMLANHGDDVQEPAGREDYQDDEPTLQEEMAKDDFQW